MSEQKHTPGPWAWFGNSKHEYYLATVHSGRRVIMDFARKGMNLGQPRFQPASGMESADELCIYQVGDRSVIGVEAAKKNSTVYRHDIIGFDSADATLIAAAPELLEALEQCLKMIEETEAQHGRNFGEGNVARDAIQKATGIRPEEVV